MNIDEEQSNDLKFNQVKSDENINGYQCGDCPTMKSNDNSNLHEMGEALEIAENRCNTLKEQLDQMRYLYQEKTNDDETNTVVSNNAGRPMVRQNSECIKTDNSGAAVLTINNILNGITNSINRLSELHSYMENDKDTKCNKRPKERSRPQTETSIDQGSRKSNTWIKKDQKKRTKRRSHFDSASLSNIKKVRPRSKAASSTPMKQDSTTSIRQRKSIRKPIKPLKRIQTKRIGSSSNHLVEIYHNDAVDYVDSDDVLNTETAVNLENRNYIKVANAETKRFNRKQEANTQCESKGDSSKQEPRSLSPIQEQETAMSNNCNQFTEDYLGFRSYETPTISSKMKQVSKGYFRNFSCKTIPFCAAKSTTPSHNIGINIQQVMSILKGKQNNKGISPTLAHNIALAADRLNRQSYSGMVQSYGNQFCNFTGAYMPCPMQNHYNYQQLQDMAQEIPEEAVEDETALDKRKCDERQDGISWSIDPNTHNNCTCASNNGVAFNQIIDKYQTTPNESGNQNSYSQSILKKSYNKYKHIRSIYSQYNETPPPPGRKIKKDSLGEISTEETTNINPNVPLGGKEKILKGVLINLHEEFASLSDKYDELSKSVNDNKDNKDKSNPDDLAKLEVLEKKLNDKEIEIQMVMSLYNEVLYLKQQVQALTEKAHMSNAMLQHQKQQFYCYNANQQQNYGFNMTATTGQYHQQTHLYTKTTTRKDNNAAMHLTKLLRQIQAYQEVCKHGGK